jgi:hypothetical protein
MLHSLKPEHVVILHELQALRERPQCNGHFRYGDGFMSLTHYRVTATREIERGLACFCSTTCLLLWEHPRMMGLVQYARPCVSSIIRLTPPPEIYPGHR